MNPALLLVLLFSAGCGYQLQTSRYDVFERYEIRTLYVAPFTNSTYRHGVDTMVYNAMVKTIAAGKRARLVSDPEKADAILTGDVSTAEMTTTASQPFDYSVSVGTFFQASLGGGFTLSRVRSVGAEGLGEMRGARLDQIFWEIPNADYMPQDLSSEVEGQIADIQSLAKYDEQAAVQARLSAIWSGGFGGSKEFPGNTKTGVLGTTADLINESEFDRALWDLAQAMTTEVHESMMAMF